MNNNNKYVTDYCNQLINDMKVLSDKLLLINSAIKFKGHKTLRSYKKELVELKDTTDLCTGSLAALIRSKTNITNYCSSNDEKVYIVPHWYDHKK